MNWDEIINFELLHVGDFHLRAGNLTAAFFVGIATWLFLKVMNRVIVSRMKFLPAMDSKRQHSIYLILKYFSWVVALVIILEVLGLKVSILLAGSAALLVGVGFGMQPIFADLVSGMFLLLEGTIKIGDVIEADGEVGRIHEIKLRTTEVLNRDNMIIIIPNSKFVVEKVVNWSHNRQSIRFTVDIGVAYGSDVERVMEILKEVMDENNKIVKRPKSFVRFTNFGDSSLDFQLIFWTNDTFRVENLKSDLRRAIHAKLKENKITIPFPQRDVHVFNSGPKFGE
ncbi:MAG: small-conductance mechanosensitive channel [Psychromonas sp.]|jgi:small-conductance mechanosensitive channel